MGKVRYAIAIVIILSLTGCSTKTSTQVNKTAKQPITIIDNRDPLEENSVETTIIDDYLYSNSYKELVNQESKEKEIPQGLKLKEPKKPQGTIIPVTPPDDSYENKEIKIYINNTDKVAFLKELNSYLKTDLMDNGFLIVQSAQISNINNTTTTIETAIKRLKVKLEAIEYKNNTLKNMFRDDTQLLLDWEKYYNSLEECTEAIMRMTDESSIKRYSKDIDINNLYKYYNNFSNKANKYLIINN